MDAARPGAVSQRPSRVRIALTLGALLLAIGVGFLGGRFGAAFKGDNPGPVRAEHLVDTATVLVSVQQLARLETVAYHMERVIDLKQREAHMFGLVNADDSILLIAVGDVVAGVDLAKMRTGDVFIERSPSGDAAVRLRIPPPELLSVRLDNTRTYVHSRKTSWLAQRNDGIETRARQLGEESIRQAALDSRILERAAQGTEQALGPLLRSLGFSRIEFVRGES